jgi:hypothetical protein
VAVPLGQPPPGRQQQGEGQVRGRAVEDAGGVADGHAAGRRGRQVDVIDAHAEVADDAHGRQPVEQVGAHGHVAVGVDALDALRPRLPCGRPGEQLDVPFQHLRQSRRQRQVRQDAREAGLTIG